MTRYLNTPAGATRASLALLCSLAGRTLHAQATVAAPLLDAMSITVATDSQSIARGTFRFRQVRTGNDVELLATGIVVRRGLRITSEWHADTSFTFRRYVAESRDSTNRVIDRVQVTSAGGRITLERVTKQRRMVREFLAQRELMILDTVALAPFVALAGLPSRTSALSLLDVRRGEVTRHTVTPGALAELAVAEVMVSGTPMTVSGVRLPLTWWRDGRGRLLRVVYGDGRRLLRDDPPI